MSVDVNTNEEVYPRPSLRRIILPIVLVAGTLTSAQTIRIEPPLIITQEEIDEGLNRLNDAVDAVARMM